MQYTTSEVQRKKSHFHLSRENVTKFISLSILTMKLDLRGNCRNIIRVTHDKSTGNLILDEKLKSFI